MQNKYDEHQNIDAKTASEIGPKIFETVCGFVNADGGYLLLGARRKVDSLFYEVVEITDPDKVQQDLVSGCSSVFDRRPRIDVNVGEIDGETVLIVAVYPEPPAPLPLYIKSDGFPKGVVIRRGSTNYYCDDDDIPFLTSQRPRHSYDTTVLERGSADDLDMDTVREYRERRKRLVPNLAEHQLTDGDFLESTSCIAEHEGKKLPTIAGVLMFGTDVAVRKHFPLFQINYIRVSGNKHSPSPGQGQGDTVLTIRGNLVRLMRRTVREILDDLPQGV